MMGRPRLFANRKVEIALGAAAFVGGSLLIRDAFDNRGLAVPWWARPFTWW